MSKSKTAQDKRARKADQSESAAKLVARIDFIRAALKSAPTSAAEREPEPSTLEMPPEFARSWHAARIADVAAQLPPRWAKLLTGVVADALHQALNAPRYGGVVGKWLAMQEEKGMGALGFDYLLVGPCAEGLPNDSREDAERLAALHDGESVLRDLMCAVVMLGDPAIRTDDEAVGQSIARVRGLREARKRELDRDLIQLITDVAYASMLHCEDNHGGRLPIEDVARWLCESFGAKCPGRLLDRSLAIDAIAKWPGRSKWKALHALARAAGMEPPSASTIKTAASRHRIAHRLR